ncbi:MAG: flagellar hook-associated protein FlgL [Panacagrimonas sp.]
MRVSTSALHQQGIANILRNQAELGRTQNELSLGTRLVSAKSNPAEWARAAGLDQHLAQLDRYRGNASVAQHHLGLEENALSSASDALNRIRELAVQANSASQSAESRRSIAQEMQSRIDELLSIANSDNGEGRYLFGGSADAVTPFSLNVSGASYSGNQSTRLVDISTERSIALGDAGDTVFLDLRSGNGSFAVSAAGTNTGTAKLDSAKLFDANAWDGDSYTLSFNAGNYEIRDGANAMVATAAYQSGTGIRFRGVDLAVSGTPADGDSFSIAPSQSQDIFATAQKLAALAGAMPTTAAGRAQQATALFGALEELDGALDHLSEVRSTVGHRLKALDDAAEQVDTLDLQSQSTLSGIRDLDYAEATARLSFQLTALQAAQQSYARVQGLSLFDFLR